jgi:hypothetical protein
MALGAIVWQSPGDCADKMNDGGGGWLKSCEELAEEDGRIVTLTMAC